MKPDELDAIEARANAATPGPWVTHDCPYDGVGDPCILQQGTDIYIAQTVYDMQSMTVNHNIDADTVFIAHARADVPRLVAEVRRLQAILADPGIQNALEELAVISAFGDGDEAPGHDCPECGEPVLEHEGTRFCDCGWQGAAKE